VPLVPLADVVAAELARVDVPSRRLRGQALPELPLPRLRALGRDLDLAHGLVAFVAGRVYTARAALDRTLVLEDVDGERSVVRFALIQVAADAIRWRDAGAPREHPYRRPLNYATDDESSARGREHAARTRASRTPPPGYVTTGDALAMLGLSRTSSSTIHRAIERGELPVVRSPEGHRFMRPADVERWAKTRRRPGQRRTPVAAGA
jgi:hypothetical protein